jgi:proteasome lid subunit RPN8/RPN11
VTVTLVLTNGLDGEIAAAAREPLETAGVLLAKSVELAGGDIRLLGRKMLWVDTAAYRKRRADALAISSDGYVTALGEAAESGLVALWFHTHPGETGIPLPSPADIEVDHRLAETFRIRADTPWYGTLIASPRGQGYAFSGALVHEAEPAAPRPIDRLWMVGDRWRLQSSYDAPGAAIDPQFDRSVRALGGPIQAALGSLKVGLVGGGGTGSAVAEQLVRLGVRHLTIIDGDTLSASNVTRVYGSTPTDVGRPKSAMLCDHLRAIAPDLDCAAIESMTTLEPTARELVGCDLIFGCSDDNAGRLVLSRIATYLMTPVIDLGVLLSSDAGGLLSGIDGRVTILSPGAACLVCRGRVDMARAATELMTPTERNRLADEGYAPALADSEPAVVAFTTAVAAAAVAELLERMIGYGPDPRPSEILLRWHEREISTNVVAPRAGHYCDPAAGRIGAGITRPFLEQVWPQ